MTPERGEAETVRTLTGTVVRGEGLGRKLGIPTANLSYEGPQPQRGVWACTVEGAAEGEWKAVCNVGVRPTVSPSGKLTVELHIPAFEGDLYGRRLTVHFKRKLRDEMKFSSLEELKAQIAKDVTALLEAP